MEAVAEATHPPGLPVPAQQKGGTLELNLRQHQFKHLAGLGSLDRAWAALDHFFAGHHEAEPVALLRLLQVVGGHQDGGAPAGEVVDQAPELPPRQGIHP